MIAWQDEYTPFYAKSAKQGGGRVGNVSILWYITLHFPAKFIYINGKSLKNIY
jgi:hypothetical protein